jgi:amidase
LVEAAPQIDGKAFARAFLTVVLGETRATIEEAETISGRRARFRDFEPATWAVSLIGAQVGAAQFSRAVLLLQRAARQIGPFFEEYDLLLTPTVAMPPLVMGALLPKGVEAVGLKLLGSLNAGRLIRVLGRLEANADKLFEFVPYTPVFNATGQPAMSVPLHWNAEGLPIGMHFVGRYADEATLFRLAGQLERARPWFNRIPPVCS